MYKKNKIMAILGALAVVAGLVTAASSIYSAIDKSNKEKQNQRAQDRQNWFNNILDQQRYEQMRADARKNWKKQNAYNHPAQQMVRLRQAGLNPHLVYGKGADATAGSIGDASYGRVNFAPGMQTAIDAGSIGGIAQGINVYQDLKMKQAQTDNVNQNTSLQQQEELFKQASTAKTLQETAKSKFDLEQANQLKDSVIEQAKLQNEKTKADIKFTVNEDQRKALASTQDVKLTMERIITEKIAHAKDQAQIEMLQEQLQALRQTESINAYEQELSRMGIYKSDPWYFRAMMNLVEGNIPTAEKIKDKIPDWLSRKPKRMSKQEYQSQPRGSTYQW